MSPTLVLLTIGSSFDRHGRPVVDTPPMGIKSRLKEGLARQSCIGIQLDQVDKLYKYMEKKLSQV